MAASIQETVRRQRKFFQSGATLSLSYRKQQLQRLYDIVKRSEAEVMAVLAADFAKPPFETFLTEYGFILSEISHTLRHLHRWSKTRKVPTALSHFGSKGFIVPEPYGVCLIIAPWNYPFQLALAPLIGAIAAGNCAVLKPSELTPHTSALLARICREAFREDYITVLEGGVEVSTALLAEPFDLIFFTGSTAVGRIVAEAAAKHLTPAVLELGGKSPTIVHHDAKLELAAKRIVWGKFLNAGQTCIAPDYVLVHRSVKEKLVQELKRQIGELYGDVLAAGSRYPAVISDRHFARLSSLLAEGRIDHGGRTDPQRRLIEPTLLTDVGWDAPVMQEEIFGPILPVLEYEDLDEVIRLVNGGPKPLALYLFTEVKEVQNRVLERIPFGGGCINDTVMHFGTPHLPFGGVGASGIGAYHGQYSFAAFSHAKGVLKQTTRFDIKLRYATTKNGLRLLRRIFR
jgi:aldehyde dehydrogenase (NAD+)